MGRSCSQNDRWSAFRILTGTPIGMRPLGRPKRRWEDSVIMDLKEVGMVSIRGIRFIRLMIGIIGEALCMRH